MVFRCVVFLVDGNIQRSEFFFKSLCQVFLYRELRCSLVTLYKDCDSILLSCFLLSNQKCSTVKGDSADWAYAKILIELCRLKGDSGVLKTV